MSNHRPIHQIAADIKREWKNVYFGAVPYLDAMMSLVDINSRYGMDSAKYIVLYFLSNAKTFTIKSSPQAKALKEELQAIIK